MGIVNATPDSFSDGGYRHGLDALVAKALSLAEEGADVIDVGGESGVTDRPAVSAREEIDRVIPLIVRLASESLLVSVDTWKAPVARAALDAGAVMVNDPSGLSDAAMAPVCAEAKAALVITHTRAAPKEKVFPAYDDVVADVASFLASTMATAKEAGVLQQRLVLDPGIDLAKTPAQSVAVLRRLEPVRELGRPVLLAVSRKDFIGALTGRLPLERLAGTLAAAGAGLEAGGSILRVHDVASVLDYLKVRAALMGTEPVLSGLRLRTELRRQPQRSADRVGDMAVPR